MTSSSPDRRSPRWLEWARQLQALSQTGLAFTDNEYDRQRYTKLADIAAEIVESCAGEDHRSLLNTFLSQVGYATPKVDVRGAVIGNGRILLVQEKVDQLWCMPGGWADVGDTPSQVATREVWEETGLRVRPIKLLGLYDANRKAPLEFFHAFKIVFLCETIGGVACPGSETLDVSFFQFDRLPPLSLNRTSLRHLADVQAHMKDPDLPAIFD